MIGFNGNIETQINFQSKSYYFFNYFNVGLYCDYKNDDT